jgi:pyruvate,water dikinase
LTGGGACDGSTLIRHRRRPAGLSFAGQYDSYLNVRGESALLAAVRRCWASVWTARAISYRLRNRVDPLAIAMAVVVQRMVRSEASGVLFTANPTTGDRDELVINASFGLGEAVVSGDVTPDRYVLSKPGRDVKEFSIGAKESMVVPADGADGQGTRCRTRLRRGAPNRRSQPH